MSSNWVDDLPDSNKNRNPNDFGLNRKGERIRKYLLQVTVKNGQHILGVDSSDTAGKRSIKSELIFCSRNELKDKQIKFFEYFKDNKFNKVTNEYGEFAIGDVVHHCDGLRTHTGVIVGLRIETALLVILTTSENWGVRKATSDELMLIGWGEPRMTTYVARGIRPYKDLYKQNISLPIHRCESLYRELYGINSRGK